MRIIVSGGRNFFNYLTVCEVLDRIHITELAHGGAVGADGLAGSYARANDIPYKVYKADWNTHGKAAGILRNIEMLNDFKPDVVVFFPGGTGTAHMKKITVDKGVAIMVYNEKGQLIEV